MQSYEEFIMNQDLCDFQQSTKWAKIKELWSNDIIIIQDNNQNILATMNILMRNLPVFGNIMYVPRGPIGKIYDENILEKLTEKMEEIARQYNTFAIIIEPNVRIENKDFINIVKKLGYKVNSKALKFDQEIQARHNFRLNLKGKSEEDIFKNFSSKTRYNVRLAIRKGVEIRERNESGLDEFYELMKETGKEYFQ